MFLNIIINQAAIKLWADYGTMGKNSADGTFKNYW